jgi:hypothetical protein
MVRRRVRLAGHPHPSAPGASIRVLRRDRLGGLIHEYSQVGPAPPDQAGVPAQQGARGDDQAQVTELAAGSSRASADSTARSAHDSAGGLDLALEHYDLGGARSRSQRPWRGRTGQARRASRTRAAPPYKRTVASRALTVPEHGALAQQDT